MRNINKILIATVLLATVAVVSISLFVYSNLPPGATSGNAQAGAALYAQYCSRCHGDLAVSARLGRTASQIENAIATVPAMKGLSGLTEQQIRDIAASLAD